MAKIKSTLTGPTVNHSQADKRIHRSESCAGTTRDGQHVYVQSNCKPLDSMIETASVRTQDVYEWKTGTMAKKKLDVLANAKRNINTLCVHPVTNARSRTKDEDYGYGGAMAYPVAPSGRRK